MLFLDYAHAPSNPSITSTMLLDYATEQVFSLYYTPLSPVLKLEQLELALIYFMNNKYSKILSKWWL